MSVLPYFVSKDLECLFGKNELAILLVIRKSFDYN
jgi:hypothetical protein